MTDVSIIMPSFNSSKFLNDAVRSVIDQSFENWELLICDDGSTDGSVALAEEWVKQDGRIFLLHNEFNKGAAGARNTCLRKARGRFIAFLDSDDLWFPDKLERQLRFMQETDASFVFGYCENISEAGKPLSITKAPREVSFRQLLFCNFLPCLTVMYDTRLLGKVEQPDIKKRNDFALWLRILRENKQVKAKCCSEVLAQYRVNNYGLSASKLSAIKYFYKCLRRYAGLGALMAGFHTLLAIAFKAMKTLSPSAYNFFVTKLL